MLGVVQRVIEFFRNGSRVDESSAHLIFYDLRALPRHHSGDHAGSGFLIHLELSKDIESIGVFYRKHCIQNMLGRRLYAEFFCDFVCFAYNFRYVFGISDICHKTFPLYN